MKNVIVNGDEMIILDTGSYIVIDCLYINDIKRCISENKISNINTADLKNTVFPYSDTPFALIELKQKTSFSTRQINKYNPDKPMVKPSNSFSTDTGLIVLINEQIFFEAIMKIDYNQVVDSILSDFVLWDKLYNDFDEYELALILSSDNDSEFDGSGTYTINLK